MRSGRIVKPLIGISCCTKQFGVFGMPNHAASNTYVRATDEIVGGVPVLIPANGPMADIETLLERLDGIILTGSRSNVHPSNYGGPPHAEGTWEDPARDGATLPLIRAAVVRGVPLLAICRGFQELNVAMGGSLHQRLQDLSDRIDHSSPMQRSVKVRQGKAHTIRITPGGWLIEGTAPDGTIEAVRVVTTPTGPVHGFAIGVQWHPEYDWPTDPVSRRIFEAFGEAVRAYMQDTQVVPMSAAAD